jgi:hypothetical protein
MDSVGADLPLDDGEMALPVQSSFIGHVPIYLLPLWG